MAVQFLFDSSGEWIAFRQGRFVYSVSGDWIGWTPWDDNDVVKVDGSYLGTIFPPNRLYRRLNQPYRGYPGYPGYGGYSPLPAMTEDVVELKKS